MILVDSWRNGSYSFHVDHSFIKRFYCYGFFNRSTSHSQRLSLLIQHKSLYGLTVRQLKRNLSWVKTAWGRSASIYSLYNINLRLNPSTSSSNIVCYNLMNYTKIGWPVLNNCFKCYIVSLLASYLSIIIYLASLLTITLI